MVVLDYFLRLGHDNHRRLSKLYAWQEKKSKASWGAEAVDYEKIAASAVQGMSAANLHHFLVVCALVSDLYCPGYNPRQPLERNSNLRLTAARYGVDTSRIANAVRMDLLKVPNKTRNVTHERKRPTTTTTRQAKRSSGKR